MGRVEMRLILLITMAIYCGQCLARVGDQCVEHGDCTGKAEICTGFGSTCVCNDTFHYQNGYSCSIKIPVGDPCTNALNECSDPNAFCRNGVCSCDPGYYDIDGRSDNVGGVCAPQKRLGENCSDVSGECPYSGSRCYNRKCVCETSYYDSDGDSENIGGRCLHKKSVGGTCNHDFECNGVSICVHGTCKCPLFYYDQDGDSDTIGGHCERQKDLGFAECFYKQNECKDPNSQCTRRRCLCMPGYYDDDGEIYNGRGICIPQIELGGECHNITNECLDHRALCLDKTCTLPPGILDNDGNNDQSIKNCTDTTSDLTCTCSYEKLITGIVVIACIAVVAVTSTFVLLVMILRLQQRQKRVPHSMSTIELQTDNVSNGTTNYYAELDRQVSHRYEQPHDYVNGERRVHEGINMDS